ncbi:MAG: vWA domain-containing protein [Erythrobacter sp.]
MRFIPSSRRALMLSACLSLLASPVLAQDPAADPPEADEEDAANYDIIVTAAMRVTQGGAKDVQHFRSIALEDLEGKLPQATSFTSEGLLSEHDLVLPNTGACEQLFCVVTHAKPARWDARTQFVGIGFDSNVDAATYKAKPLSLIAVVDRSGSMSGEPIARVKEGLRAVLSQMREGDRFGIVIYGSETVVHQPVMDVEGNRAALERAIDAIEINGSTYMEAGLRLGFETAFAELGSSRGKTRLMLFTDENPNVGDTSAEGFMGQAIDGSRKGVDMTTIGVGAHFDAELATEISSVRGGNLFFLPTAGSGKDLFAREFRNMVSPVAYDLVLSIDPAEGMKVGAVYGVPGELIEDAGAGTVTVTIASAFLSSNGGGIFATLEGAAPAGGSPLAQVSVSYTDAITDRRESDAKPVLAVSGTAPANLAKAEVLVDQFRSTRAALEAYHDEDDPAAAAAILAQLSERMEESGASGLKEELKLVDTLQQRAAKLAGLVTDARTEPYEVVGSWRVVRHQGVEDVARGDIIEITADGEFYTERRRGDDIDQRFAINERQLHIEDTDLVFNYSIRGNRLTLHTPFDGVKIVMEREET